MTASFSHIRVSQTFIQDGTLEKARLRHSSKPVHKWWERTFPSDRAIGRYENPDGQVKYVSRTIPQAINHIPKI